MPEHIGCIGEGCPHCQKFAANPAGYADAMRRLAIAQCVHLGEQTGHTVTCERCPGRVELKLFKCSRYGQCTLQKSVDGVACCNGSRSVGGRHEPCDGFSLTQPVRRKVSAISAIVPGATMPSLKWAYGVTTVPQRKATLLPRTLASLAAAGFDRPRLFVDGARDGWDAFGLEVTYRFPVVRTFGNWILSLYELYIRDPQAQRYAIFQDDLITYPGLRHYLSVCPFPQKGYWNLYTFPSNQTLCPPGHQGWYLSNQFGRGAMALVFGREGVVTLLSAFDIAMKPQAAKVPTKNVDGAVINAMSKAGWKEWVHSPSLTQHTGEQTSITDGTRPHPRQLLSESFRGESFDARELIPCKPSSA